MPPKLDNLFLLPTAFHVKDGLYKFPLPGQFLGSPTEARLKETGECQQEMISYFLLWLVRNTN